MNKIQLTANPDTNYVFHMLSVAGCGYDNAYGALFRERYPAADLCTLNDNAHLLTVCGGAYCGELYDLLVCIPACARVTAKEYYSQIIADAKKRILAPQYEEHLDRIIAISTVMVKHYDSYVTDIWNTDRKKIEAYILPLHDYFCHLNFTEKAEAAVGHILPNAHFIATLVASVEDGAEAIDISREQDVFGIERSLLDAVYFIGHEFIIYLLMDALREENAFQSLETWPLTEGLAEFYLKKVMGDTRFFNGQQAYVAFYEECERRGAMTAVTLYRMAVERFLD